MFLLAEFICILHMLAMGFSLQSWNAYANNSCYKKNHHPYTKANEGFWGEDFDAHGL